MQPFIEKGEKVCSFCFKSPEHVAHMFMGPGAEGEPGTPFVCNRCVATLSDALEQMKIPPDPNQYCRICRFEIYGRTKRVLAGHIHAACAYELALWCLGIRSLPYLLMDGGPAEPGTRRFKLQMLLNSSKRYRLVFWLAVMLLAFASFTFGRLTHN